MRYYDHESMEDELDRMRVRQQTRRENRGRGSAQRERQNVSRKSDSRPEKTAAAASRNHRRRSRRRFPVGLVLAAFVLAAVAVFFFNKSMKEEGYWTVAVFGVDSRDGKTGRGALSDVEMIASINRKTGEIRLASVFRDSYLQIDSEGSFDKINEAYFLGGYEQAVDALQMNFDLSIDDYATFNWKAVADAINVLGGVDIEITDKEFAYINSFITETVNSTGIGSVQLTQAGMNHLDGVQAVAYARLRLMDTDFNRTERQRKVLGLAMEKAKQADFNTIRTLVGAVYPQISTSIGVDDLLRLARKADQYYIGQTSGFPFSHTEMTVDKKSCVIPTTLESNVIQLHAYLYDDTGYQPSGMVRSISSQIAKKTGLEEPGKDTESGKNVGAQGNTGSGQSVPLQTAAAVPQETAGQTAAETQEEAVTEASAEESEETGEDTGTPEEGAADESDGTQDMEETIPAHETGGGPGSSNGTSPTPGTGGAGSSSGTGSGSSGSGSGNSGAGNGSVTAPGGSISGPGGNGTGGPGSTAGTNPGAGSSPAQQGPGSTGNHAPQETTAALEAPGQGGSGNDSTAAAGPGVTAQ